MLAWHYYKFLLDVGRVRLLCPGGKAVGRNGRVLSLGQRGLSSWLLWGWSSLADSHSLGHLIFHFFLACIQKDSDGKFLRVDSLLNIILQHLGDAVSNVGRVELSSFSKSSSDNFINQCVVLLIEAFTGLFKGAEFEEGHSNGKEICFKHDILGYLGGRSLVDEFGYQLRRKKAESFPLFTKLVLLWVSS